MFASAFTMHLNLQIRGKKLKAKFKSWTEGVETKRKSKQKKTGKALNTKIKRWVEMVKNKKNDKKISGL